MPRISLDRPRINSLKQKLNGTKASTDEKTAVNSHLNELPYKFDINVKEFD